MDPVFGSDENDESHREAVSFVVFVGNRSRKGCLKAPFSGPVSRGQISTLTTFEVSRPQMWVNVDIRQESTVGKRSVLGDSAVLLHSESPKTYRLFYAKGQKRGSRIDPRF